MFWLVFFTAFAALFSLAALVRSLIVGDYRSPRRAESVTPCEPLEPDPAVAALKADLKREFAIDQMRAQRGY